MSNAKKTRLFTPVPDGGDWRLNAVVGGGWADDHLLAIGFADLGILGLQKIIDDGPEDGLFVPSMYCLRHGCELVLKAAIRDTARVIRQDDFMHGRSTRAALDRDRLNADLGNEHGIGPLLNRLDNLLRDAGLEPVPSDTRQTLLLLHNEDPSGQGLRYSDVFDVARDATGAVIRDAKGRPERVLRAAMPRQLHIDVASVGSRMRQAFDLLSGGLLTYLDAVLSTQADMLAEYAEMVREYEAEMRSEYDDVAREYEAEMRAEYEAEMRESYADYL